MEDAELQKLLLATYADEAKENVENINTSLLALEAGVDDAAPVLEQIFRDAHSLKGASRAVEFHRVEQIAHHLEDLFCKLQSGDLDVSGDVVDAALKALDAISSLNDYAAGGEEPDLDDEAIIELLNAAGAPQDTPPAKASTKAKASRAPGKAKATAKPAADETIRVSTSKLDALMAEVGELLSSRIEAEQRLVEVRSLNDQIAEADGALRKLRRLADRDADDDLRESLQKVTTAFDQLRDDAEQLQHSTQSGARSLGQTIGRLQDEVRRTRMLPVSTILDTFPRLVRDLSRELGKQVELTVTGGSTEVDRAVLEQLKSPLTHMVRNSVDHGLEIPADREAAGKSAQGTIRLDASQRGANLVLVISDDGAGINPEGVKASAVAKGLITQEQADAMSDREAVWLIFRSGFSTRAEVTDVSGRGVGMDVVREQVERLQGIIDVESQIGAGSTFTLTLPVSVATTNCLLVRAHEQRFAIPLTNAERILRPDDATIGSVDGRPAVVLDGRPLPLASLSGVLGLPHSNLTSDSALVVIASADRRAVVQVEAVLGAQETAVKSLPHPLIRVTNFAGATIVGSGEIVGILNVADVLREAASGAGGIAVLTREEQQAADERDDQPAGTSAPSAVTAGTRALVVDDSLTLRTLEKAMLQAAGYEVLLAADGIEAWKLLQDTEVDVVVSDVEMPHMNGFELTKRIRDDARLAALPVVLVTSLNSTSDRQRGVDAGADAYVVKGSAEQEQLLQTLSRLT